ncbi:cold-shock protein [Cohnella sp.]|uniref:cold-shock protein n=1 Tax=Cohnella sp. TaxID=1883426 RepID=UPI003567020B
MNKFNSVWDGLKGPEMDEINALIGPNLGMSPRKKAEPVPEEPEDPNRLLGRITKYNEARGFGFIQAEDDTEYFIHASAFAEGVEVWRGARVSFELSRNIQTGKTSAVNARFMR